MASMVRRSLQHPFTAWEGRKTFRPLQCSHGLRNGIHTQATDLMRSGPPSAGSSERWRAEGLKMWVPKSHSRSAPQVGEPSSSEGVEAGRSGPTRETAPLSSRTRQRQRRGSAVMPRQSVPFKKPPPTTATPKLTPASLKDQGREKESLLVGVPLRDAGGCLKVCFLVRLLSVFVVLTSTTHHHPILASLQVLQVVGLLTLPSGQASLL